MFVPNKFQLTDQKLLEQFIAHNRFGVMITTDLNATHLPFMCEADENGDLCLFAHMARANPHWKNSEGSRALVVFTGPHAYISPTWYANRPAVPTWNYTAVHCYGKISLLDENDTQQSMDQLVSLYEPQLLANEQVMPEEYQQRLRKAVVGFKLVIDNIQGKEKLGQHRTTEDQLGVHTALQQSSNPVAQLLAEYMLKRNLGIGDKQSS
ncbi:FMN-binding negative transcriptional regulator [Aliiglaciecola lipolytica]|uniref:Transcriptional regulator n=1 Tax=Aliiglaciecola lipolytica E3 TaxID=1127673 RepID=K6XRE4_9ALTE|nr:FMN-binding negative transcriptional regulator [Aliiglaciecola lipolytica]GAC14256.1 transcriptional regulator [Aliiglaciecola lipolytica E3]